jgi:multiple sugar transport system ATP-binding protein
LAEIRLEGISKSFGDATVVTHLDLIIRDGEFFTLVGPSGCGKSTILNMIAGLETVTEGKIYFDDVEVNHLSPRERDVAMVFQNYALYPHMTVFENIAFPLRMQKAGKNTIKSEVERMISLLGLKGLDRRKPAELSGGQRQRVALARAIVRRPKVFLLDEPLSNLDAQLRIGMRAEIKKLQREMQITTVFVSHDQGEAMSLSDRMAIFNEGRIQQCGRPLEVYHEPINVFVGGFIGSPPMNFMDAAVVGEEPFRIECSGLSLFPGIGDRSEVAEGTRLIAGIRPEDVMVFREERKGTVDASVLLVEPTGAFDWVDVLRADLMVRGRSEAAVQLKAQDRVFVKIPSEKIVLFDKSSGKRIGRKAGTG